MFTARLVASAAGALLTTTAAFADVGIKVEPGEGDLTLHAQGDPDAIWVFQMATTLTTTIDRQVILINSAAPGNVYWQVGSSATIGIASTFQGTIMADQAITLSTGATLNGRALARIAAVTLDSNTAVMP